MSLVRRERRSREKSDWTTHPALRLEFAALITGEFRDSLLGEGLPLVVSTCLEIEASESRTSLGNAGRTKFADVIPFVAWRSKRNWGSKALHHLPGMARGCPPGRPYSEYIPRMAWRLGRPWGGCAACGRARLAPGLYFRNVQECCGLREGLCSALCLEGRREIGAWHGSWHATPSGFCRREAHHYGNINAGAPPE